MPTYTIEGRRTRQGCVVDVVQDGQRVPIRRRLDLVSHSPTGLEWGYGGSGPAQLALAILAQVVGDNDALALHQDYKRDVVAALPYQRWTITSDQVREWVDRRKAGGPV